jgi:hypothetical protein
MALLYCCEPRIKIFNSLFQFKEEITIFLWVSNNDDGNLCSSEDFVRKLSYLVDAFEETK